MENPTVVRGPLNVGQSDICRLCMKCHEYYQNIFVSNEEFKMSICKAIQDLLLLEVAKGDSLPETVCCPCATKLMDFRNFKEMCVNSARELGKHAPMEGITCPVKVEILDGELVDEGERNNWKEFVGERGSPHSNGTSEALKVGVKDGDASGQHEEYVDIGEEEHVKKELFGGARVYIESSAAMSGDQCPVEGEGVPMQFMDEGGRSSLNVENKFPVPNEACDPLSFDNPCPDRDEFVPIHLPVEVASRNWSYTLDREPRVSVVPIDSLVPLALENQAHPKEVYPVDPLGECDYHGEEDINEGNCNKDDAVGRELKRIVAGDQGEVKKELEYTELVDKGESSRYEIVDEGNSTIESNPALLADPLVVMSMVDRRNNIGEITEKLANKSDKTHWDGVTFVCDTCGREFMKKSDLVKHLNIHPDSKQTNCRSLGKKFKSEDSLKTKRRSTHTIVDRFKCDLCGREFRRKHYLQLHIWSHSSGKPFECEVCGKIFQFSSKLKSHSVIHSDAKPFKCNFCGKMFARSSNLKCHSKTHTGVRPFKCDVCGKMFTRSNCLKSHKFTHSGVKPFKCELCGKMFAKNFNLKNHVVIHAGLKPFNCNVCGKVFTERGSLKRHSVIHTGVKKFKCDLCGKTFAQSSHLKTHLFIHTGQKPFKCDVCGRAYKFRSGFNLHLRTHADTRPST